MSSLVLQTPLQLMEDGAFGHHGQLAMLIVVEELRQEEESATDHSQQMEGRIATVILMKQQHVICSHVLQTPLQLMEDGAFGDPGHLAMLDVVVEL